MITEEQKQEADRIVEKYRPFASMWDCYWDNPSIEKNDIKSAIQDRQSVLDLATRLRSNSLSASSLIIDNEIQSLTNQISYLKSKI